MRAESQLPAETSSSPSPPPLASDSTATEAPSPSSMTFTSYTDVTSSVVIDVLHRHVQDTDDKTRNVFFGGAVSATTTVVYYPFVATFPPVFTSALSTGEGLSGVVAGVLGIWQDPGASTMHLSVSNFFTCAAGVFGIAMVAYWFLATSTISAQVQHSKIFLSSTHRRDYVLRNLWKPLMFQVLLCAMSFGVIPSIMPFLGSKYMVPNEIIILLGVTMVLSSTSSNPLFSTFTYGGIARTCLRHLCLDPDADDVIKMVAPTSVAANCSFVFLFAYTQTMVYLTLKREVRGNEAYAKTAYQWSGFMTQMGALGGTVVIFPLVTYTTWFQPSYGA
ncbi:hypothetical protein DYB34_005119 [Aphanomyces astaci]|uniref:Uncharacterized protein n=1 Tax=Aphanomyces astaci TaxID=112090 RepID=A0A3R6ZAW1_APHAT|nr:hypothetical protein DYB34_005119 [Aphanomyces astaci]